MQSCEARRYAAPSTDNSSRLIPSAAQRDMKSQGVLEGGIPGGSPSPMSNDFASRIRVPAEMPPLQHEFDRA
jgi:hypothetical protein